MIDLWIKLEKNHAACITAQYVASDWQINYRPETRYFPHNYTAKHAAKRMENLPQVSKTRVRRRIPIVFGFHVLAADQM